MKNSEINKLGKELELFETIDCIGKGFPVFLPRGAMIVKKIQNEIEEMLIQNNYKSVKTPSISNFDIFKIEDRYINDTLSHIYLHFIVAFTNKNNTVIKIYR